MFKDRQGAARRLALEIGKQIKEKDFVIAAILRGGIVLGRIIADYFNLPLEPLVVRKMGAPNEEELAIGALGPKKTIYWDEDLIARLRINKNYKSSIVKEKSYELEKMENLIKEKRKPFKFSDKKVIIVDDGVATGTTVLCANMFLKKVGAKSIILATPVIAKDTFNNVNRYFDKIIALEIVENFYAVGQFYKDFPQVTDEEVVRILNIKN